MKTRVGLGTYNVCNIVPTVVIESEGVFSDDDRTNVLDEHRSNAGVAGPTRKPNHPRLVRVGISQGAVRFLEAPEERGVVGTPDGVRRYAARPVTRQRPCHILQRLRDFKVWKIHPINREE